MSAQPPFTPLTDDPAIVTTVQVLSEYGLSRYQLKYALDHGEFPQPDLVIGRRQRWRRGTLVRWFAEKQKENGRNG